MGKSSSRRLAAAAAVVLGRELGAVAVGAGRPEPAGRSERRWVCDACHGVYFAPVNGVCPGCTGPGRERVVTFDAAGVARVPQAD